MIENKTRHTIILVTMLLSFAVITFRLTGISLSGSGKKNISFLKSKKVLRGNIYDRNGSILAVSQLVSSVFANPKEFDEVEIVNKLDSLALLLKISKDELIQKLNLDRSFNWLKRKVSRELGQRVLTLNMKGVSVQNEYKRVYPHHHLASHVLGFTGTDDIGLEGLEYTFNSTLKPKKSNISVRNIIYGKNIYLTLDLRMQNIAEHIIKKGVERTNAKDASIIIVDSSNGEILTMANYPDFDNNNFAAYDKSFYRNTSVTDYYEPGSIFKIFTTAILLEEGLVDENYEFECTGKIVVHNREIKCNAKHGKVNLRAILKKSCNVGIIKASFRIPKHTFYNYLNRFGFGAKTRIQLVGESIGLLRPYKELTTLSKGMTSFGYEIAVTPIQLIMAASVIANKGMLLKPILIKKITELNGKPITVYTPTSRRKVISPKTANKLMKLLKSVLEPGGTGAKAYLKGFNLAGKTSTITIYDKSKRAYSKDEVNTAFIGFIPQYNRILSVLIIVRKPKTAKIASNVVVPMFKQLVLGLAKKGLVHR